jgi:hypothetical protein
MSKRNYHQEASVDNASFSQRGNFLLKQQRMNWRCIAGLILVLAVLVPVGVTRAGAPVQGFSLDICLQDDVTGDTLKISSGTGQYRYTRCSDGRTLTGLGEVTNIAGGCRITLEDRASGRLVSAILDNCAHSASASLRLAATVVILEASIKDSNTVDNTCDCSFQLPTVVASMGTYDCACAWGPVEVKDADCGSGNCSSTATLVTGDGKTCPCILRGNPHAKLKFP